ncbi:hypothetical protein Xmau_00175 [Xenorhabdus mauleonii]|uniref:DUF1266 domain-containing protein n=1 Tax=Xenorhabdus mauleonii TaxID=351675 RepID=A0A1I3N461_9GAMM|nr:DUF1266 domain-containing protein [Xenorhabdus mauleonii]PHM45787.1 hypothetical protein Xmau_00175 [Xenorhabdus mauleonii]SFJ04027.1 Protein of unknown function [Xenorhabdus mauleonii]
MSDKLINTWIEFHNATDQDQKTQLFIEFFNLFHSSDFWLATAVADNSDDYTFSIKEDPEFHFRPYIIAYLSEENPASWHHAESTDNNPENFHQFRAEHLYYLVDEFQCDLVIYNGHNYVIFDQNTLTNIKNSAQGENETYLPDNSQPFTPSDWGMILGAPYSCFNGWSCNDYSQEEDDGGLASAWGIENRDDLVYQLFTLLVRGHAVDYYRMRDELSELSKPEFDEMLAGIQKSDMNESDKQETIWRYTMMYNNENDIQDIQYVAWDYVRFSMLCLNGCKLQYISEQEAKNWALMLAPLLRMVYSGWDNLWYHFALTRWFWASTDGDWAECQSEYVNIIRALLNDENSPTNVIDWNSDLPPTETHSFAQALTEVLAKQNPDIDFNEVHEAIREQVRADEL